MHQPILKIFLESNPDIFNTYHDAKGSIIYVSETLEQLMELPLKGWSADQIMERIFPIDKRHLKTWMLRNLRGELSTPPSIIFRFKSADGVYRWIESTFHGIDSGLGDQYQFFLTRTKVIDQWISYYLQAVYQTELAKNELQERINAIKQLSRQMATAPNDSRFLSIRQQLDDLLALNNNLLQVSRNLEDAVPELEEVNLVFEFGKFITALEIRYPDALDAAISYKGIAVFALADRVKLELVFEKLYTTIIEASIGIAMPEFTICYFRDKVALAVQLPGIMKLPAFLNDLLDNDGMIKTYIREMEGDIFSCVLPEIGGYQVIILLPLVPLTLYIR